MCTATLLPVNMFMNKHDNNREYNPMSLATSVTQQYYQMLQFLDKILGNIISDHSRSPQGGSFVFLAPKLP